MPAYLASGQGGGHIVPSSTINSLDDYAPGWLGRYCSVMGQDVAPLSFHLLAGMCVLGSVIGRKAALHRPGGIIWPPTSILLLGASGVGKSLALQEKAYRVAAAATANNENFYLSEGAFSQSGFVEDLKRHQLKGIEVLEGIHFEDEASMILTRRTGSETTAQWMIKALAYRPELGEKTVGRGKVVLRNFTIAFALGTTLPYLRKAISVDDFTGGFMQRFLISHEASQRDDEGITPTEGDVHGLAQELVEIRQGLPDRLGLCDKVEARIRSLGNQAKKKHYDSIHLDGFWNRYAMLLLKLSSLMAMAGGNSRVELAHVEPAQALLDTKLYPILEGLISELSAAPDKKHLLDITDSLRKAGPEGWSLKQFFAALNTSSDRRQMEYLQAARKSELLWEHGQRVYGMKSWMEDERDG